MHNPIFLVNENELNKVLRNQKRSGEEVKILFTSTWDAWATALVAKVVENTDVEGPRLYIVNSFTMPHAFVIFNTTKLPHLVTINRSKVRSEDYLPRVYKSLGV